MASSSITHPYSVLHTSPMSPLLKDSISPGRSEGETQSTGKRLRTSCAPCDTLPRPVKPKIRGQRLVGRPTLWICRPNA
eukprot:26295-Eustigmatos_ZCMA.PRE.1